MRFLDNVLQDFIDRAPAGDGTRAKYAAKRERSVGLGLMGFHSFLQAPERAVRERAGQDAGTCGSSSTLRREADAASRTLADERGACPDAAERGVMERFSHKLAIAPTASISIICGGTSRLHRADPGQHLHPQDPVGLLRGQEPLSGAAAGARRATNTDGGLELDPGERGLGPAPRLPEPGREGRLQDRLRDRPALGDRAGRRPHAGHLPVASRSTSSCPATSTNGTCTCSTGRPGSGASSRSTTCAPSRCSAPRFAGGEGTQAAVDDVGAAKTDYEECLACQ